MKKIRWVKFWVFAFLLTGGVQATLAAGTELQAKSVSGVVTVVRDGKTALVQNGDLFFPEDRLTTAGDGRLDIIKPGGWGYRLLQSSECVIHADDNKTEIEMLRGDVIFKVVPTRGRNLTVRTPVVVAAVRGTQFWGRVTPSGISHNATFAVREGDVEITALKSAHKVMLRAGQALDVQGLDGSVLMREAKPAELEAIHQIKDLDLR